MRKPEMKPLTSVAIKVRKDRDSLKTGIPMEIVRMLRLEAGSVIEWEPMYERRQVILKTGLKKPKGHLILTRNLGHECYRQTPEDEQEGQNEVKPFNREDVQLVQEELEPED